VKSIIRMGLAVAAGAAGVLAASNAGSQPAPAAAQSADSFSVLGELTQGGWIRGTVPPGTASLALDGKAFAFAPDGSFFAAFDRDAGPEAKLVATLANGSTMERDLTISPRAWQIETVNVPLKVNLPDEEYLARRKPEVAQIAAARALDSGSQGWRQHFIWPLKGRISGQFGSQRVYKGGEKGSYHSGIDIATGESGNPFVAPADGVVILVANPPFTLEGNLLMIDHGMGLNSAFLHCSEVDVKVGDHVTQGQLLGHIGMTGRATGPHLHWSLMWRGSRLDPLLFTGPMN
jgi:murein DD-endopeptidase MepM/ murein hydrolase activator NlpD